MAIPVFIAYARVDEAFCKALVKHIGVLEKQGLVRVWYDEFIPKGADWEEEIHKHLDEARLVVFLVSADFLHSEYCHDQEMKRALARHRSGEAQVIPVIVRACGWTRTELGQIQALPKDAKPVSTWGDKDEAWLSVVDGVEAAALKLKEADERAERERVAAERAEAARAERERAAAERVMREQIERERRAAEKAERERLAALLKPAPPSPVEKQSAGIGFSWKKARWAALGLALVVGVLVALKLGRSLGEGGTPISSSGAQIPEPLTSATAQVEAKDGGAEEAGAASPPPVSDAPEALAGVAPMSFKKLPGGKYRMGSPPEEANRDSDEQQHPAEVASFEIGVYEVTQKQWKAVMNTTPFYCAYGCGDDLPAQSISWGDALLFMNKLTELENKRAPEGGKRTVCYSQKSGEWTWDRSCTGYRLPTEAEWEYAARAGTKTAYSFGDDAKELCLYGNGGDQAAKTKHPEWTWLTTVACPDDGYKELAPVGRFKPNPWGLHDMHGNVWEWTWDRYADYPPSSTVGYAGPENKVRSDDVRVVRGGSFVYEPGWLRSSLRYGVRPTVRFRLDGFRCVRGAPQP